MSDGGGARSSKNKIMNKKNKRAILQIAQICNVRTCNLNIRLSHTFIVINLFHYFFIFFNLFARLGKREPLS